MSDNDAPWLLQASLKTPGGALINARGIDKDQLAVSLAAISELTPLILAMEQALLAGGAVASALPLAPKQPAAPQGWNPPAAPPQAPPQQQGWGAQLAPPQQWGAQRPSAPAAQQAPQGGVVCNHGTAAKWVEPGISKSSGRPYKGFYACAMGRDQDCGFKQ